MLPRSGFLLADSKSNSSTRLPLRTTTRVSSGWEASMIILLDMCNSRGARAGGSVRPGWALEVQARRANVGRKKVKRTRRHGDGPASVKAKRIGCAATAAPRARACGPKDNLLRPGHDDPKTRRTRTSSPFEGRRQSANVPQRLAIAGPGPTRVHLPTSTANSMRNAFAQHKEDDECPDMRLRDETILDRRGPPTRRSNPVSKGADDAFRPGCKTGCT